MKGLVMNDLDLLINDIACIDPIYIDGAIVEAISNLGPNLMVPFYRWEAERDGNGGLRMRRVPALRLIGPRNTLLPIAPVIAALEHQQPPAIDRLMVRH
jgi:hypothetical protein